MFYPTEGVLTPSEILDTVCVVYGLDRQQLELNSHNGKLTCVSSRARRAAFWWLTKGYGLGFRDALNLVGLTAGSAFGTQSEGLIADYEGWLKSARLSGKGERYGIVASHRRIAELLQVRLDMLDLSMLATATHLREHAARYGVWKAPPGDGPGL